MIPEPRDITSRADIERLVNSFYERVRADEILGPIFDDVAQTDWAVHLPKMYDFWDAVLFGTPGFRGDPLRIHLALSRRVQLGAREFTRWIELFHDTVNTQFSGPIAEEAMLRALRIAAVMQHHVGAAEESFPATA